MADVPEVSTLSPSELLGAGRRNLAVKDYSAAAETLSTACELLAKEHGETADQCAEAYLWYGKALLGLSREETGVLGDGVPGTGNVEDDDDDDDNEEDSAVNGDQNGDSKDKTENGEVEKCEAESTTNDDEAGPSVASAAEKTEIPGSSNGEGNDESAVDLEDDEVDNLQHAWEMLEMARSILHRRVENGGGDAARSLLADVHLTLGEVALESETYDKAVLDMQSCLEIQKDLYRSDDRRIAETHYQIGLANSLASNFEDAITHFKNAANILETRIKILENPSAATEDATVKKFSVSDPLYSVEGEIKELKELLPEIQEKIQDMMDYKAETMRRLRETLFSNGDSSQAGGASTSSDTKQAADTKPSADTKPAADISHLIKRKRKSSENEEVSASKRSNT